MEVVHWTTAADWYRDNVRDEEGVRRLMPQVSENHYPMAWHLVALSLPLLADYHLKYKFPDPGVRMEFDI